MIPSTGPGWLFVFWVRIGACRHDVTSEAKWQSAFATSFWCTHTFLGWFYFVGMVLLLQAFDGADIIVPELGDVITLQDLMVAPAAVRDARTVPAF
jgi:hypothetical protein